MRTTIVVALILAFAAVASADDRLAVFVSDLGYESFGSTTFDGVAPVNHKVSEWSGGVGVALDHSWNARWSTEASVGFDRRYTTRIRLDGGIPATARESYNTLPLDVMMRFRFPNDSRWTPYLATGAHYVGAPDIVSGRVDPIAGIGIVPITFQRYGDRFSAQLGIGSTFRITPRVGLQFDLKRQLRQDGVFFDPLTRGSFGVNVSF